MAMPVGLSPTDAGETVMGSPSNRFGDETVRSVLRNRIRLISESQEDGGTDPQVLRSMTTLRRKSSMVAEVQEAIQDVTDEVGQFFPLFPMALVYGFTAVWLVVRLTIYAALITPAALKYVYAYFFDNRIIHRVRYGPNRRNFLDIYLPPEATAAQARGAQKLPVVIGVMGGAWVMGHRSWNTQFGMRLLDAGVILVAVDYRNYPIGQVPDMVEDVGRAIAWVRANIKTFGGDVNNMVLHAQSAGAHLSAMLMIEHGLLSATGDCEQDDCSSVKGLKGVVLVSGPYDLEAMQPHLVARGLNAKMLSILTVDGDLAACSPTLLLESDEWKEHGKKAAENLPPIYLFHGTTDKAVPSWSSVRFAKKLQDVGVKDVTLDIRQDCTHTLPIIEGPMRGKHDMQVELVLPFLLGKQKAKERLAKLPKRPSSMPEFIVKIAEW
eukprot:CAMPEP_0206447022 /NCGR_PEP_ID=MMETSP0324_2-20121206/16513_1 /ASSEMBLY_ACC=CAM_ASM_000836 /TAXON_ID=2866 /ORGANISM="Crypthecodinium cohnii, Strain Seligo" /LENGTH=436 /DNA_ID=CAMNT_0053915663 /DNA_START=94 /DNA_END=1401 /DNA_ORIENTATION=-